MISDSIFPDLLFDKTTYIYFNVLIRIIFGRDGLFFQETFMSALKIWKTIIRIGIYLNKI